MTELLTSAQMRAIEQAAIDSGEVTGLELMERAGRGVVDAVFRWRPELETAPHRAVVLCGPGNNGGDGYVIARLLRDLHWDVDVHALAPSTTADAQAMAARWTGAVLPLTEKAIRNGADADLYVDAILGTGLTRAPEGDLAALLRYLGGAGGDTVFFMSRLVAVDAPSGLCLDSGRALAGYGLPHAGLTVTFECPKIGHFLAQGPAACGALDVVDLGLARLRAAQLVPEIDPSIVRPPMVRLAEPEPRAAPTAQDVMMRWTATTKDEAGEHKFDHGHCMVVAGGMGRTGAARLAARAALRMGAGLVTVAAPGSAMLECATQLTAIMLRRCDDAGALAALLEDTRITSLCIGPGLGLEVRHRDLVAAALDSGKPCVLDADALTLVAGDVALQEKLHENCVLTPHMGEFRRLCPDLAEQLEHPIEQARKLMQQSLADPLSETAKTLRTKALEMRDQTLSGPAFSKVDAARAASDRFGCSIVLKGPDTVFAQPGGLCHVHACAYGREAPWLATAGAGDVLAGMIAGEMAKSPNAFTVFMPAAIWLHAEAARSFGPGLIAEDLPEEIPKVLSRLSRD